MSKQIKKQVTFRLGEKIIEKIKLDSIKEKISYSNKVEILILKGLLFDDLLIKQNLVDFNDPIQVKFLIDHIYHSDYYTN